MRFGGAPPSYWMSGAAGDGGKPGFGLHQHVVGLARRVRAGLAVATNRADDEARMRAAQLLEREAELRHRAGLEVLHEHVGLGDDRREQRLVLFARKIEHQRFLAAVEPDEIRALAGRAVATRALAVANDAR